MKNKTIIKWLNKHNCDISYCINNSGKFILNDNVYVLFLKNTYRDMRIENDLNKNIINILNSKLNPEIINLTLAIRVLDKEITINCPLTEYGEIDKQKEVSYLFLKTESELIDVMNSFDLFASAKNLENFLPKKENGLNKIKI